MRHRYIPLQPEDLRTLRVSSKDPKATGQKCKRCGTMRLRAHGLLAYSSGDALVQKSPECKVRKTSSKKKLRGDAKRAAFLNQLPSDHIHRLQQGFLKAAYSYIEGIEINGVRFMPGDGISQHMLSLAIVYHLDEVHMGEEMPEDMIEKVGRGVVDRNIEVVKRQVEETVSIPMQVIKIPAGGGFN